jgi:hypothetical protein
MILLSRVKLLALPAQDLLQKVRSRLLDVKGFPQCLQISDSSMVVILTGFLKLPRKLLSFGGRRLPIESGKTGVIQAACITNSLEQAEWAGSLHINHLPIF